MDESTIKGIKELDPALSALPNQSRTASNEIVGQQEFMTLLVTQLQNQDPLNPMEQEEFAVQLAQFTQVEQLVSINEKLESEQSAADFSSLASYLGQEVLLGTSTVSVDGGEGGQVSFDLAQDAADVTLQLLDGSGIVKEEVSLGAMSAGKQAVELTGLSSSPGDYSVVAQAVTAQGTALEPEVNVSGIVSGYVPGPDPTLLVGNRPISTADIREVRIPSAS